MTKKQIKESIRKDVDHYGADVLDSDTYAKSDQFIQHGNTTTREHMISTACVCLEIARGLRLHCDEQSLVRGALLHDFFLYDWHEPSNTHPPKHPTRHSSYALANAAEDFSINPLEAEIIREHMFPVTFKVPRHKEAWILTIADKVCTLKETFSRPVFADIVQEIKNESR